MAIVRILDHPQGASIRDWAHRISLGYTPAVACTSADFATNGDIIDMLEWLRIHMKSRNSAFTPYGFLFENEDDALLFYLTWGG